MVSPVSGRGLACALGVFGLVVSSVCPASAEEPSVYELVRSALAPEEIDARLKRYVETDLGLQRREVPAEVSGALTALARALDQVDEVYWKQVSPDGWRMLQKLQGSKAKQAQQLAQLLQIHYGPWDRHADDEPFVGQVRRPPGVNFYPLDMSRRELEQYIVKNPSEAAALWGPYSMIRRQNGKLSPQLYSKFFREHLQSASTALREAAAKIQCADPATCKCGALAQFLEARARSFLDDDYRRSEMMWLDTGECPLDVAIGPYEFYEDRLLGLKTAFGAFVYLRDDKESERFKSLLAHYDHLTAELPLTPALKDRFKLTKPSPITVADVLRTAGDARAGYQVRAFILPNDEAVRRAKGSKNVILRNVVQAKFDKLAMPVAKRIFDKKALKNVSFDAYFDILLAWQVAHGVVPREIILPDGTKTTARQNLRERSVIVDTIKGEVVALLNYLHLMKEGALNTRSPAKLAHTYLASLFDVVRLGVGSPQTIARTIIYNYLVQEWVFRYNPKTQTFEVNPPGMQDAVKKLAAETLEILGRGDYDGAGRLIVQYGIMPAEMRQKLAEVRDLPVDIAPRYVSMPSSN